MAAAPTSGAGLGQLADPRVDDVQGMPRFIWYPTNAPEHAVSVGRLRIEAGKDAPPLPGLHPLIVFSHGPGGWSMSHWKTARYFARRGYVVLALIHDNDDVGNSSSSSALAVWQSRPKEWSAALDTLLASQFAALVDRSRIVAMGFSAGGYTALTVDGRARPHWPWMITASPIRNSAMCTASACQINPLPNASPDNGRKRSDYRKMRACVPSSRWHRPVRRYLPGRGLKVSKSPCCRCRGIRVCS